jgi:predicted molibdopterin-dependent oxidoreductase YjgC
LYDATGHKKYLTTAQKLTDEAIRNFWDKQNFGFKISNNKRISNNKEHNLQKLRLVKFGYQFVRVSSRFDKSYPAKNRLSFALLVNIFYQSHWP